MSRIFAAVFFLFLSSSFYFCSFPLLSSDSSNLYTTYEKYFYVGVALSKTDTADDIVMQSVLENFNSMTHEFAMKWSQVETSPGVYDFSYMDDFAGIANKNNFRLIGHTLVWHKANPSWLFTDRVMNDDMARDFYLEVMRKHIATMVARYRGKVHGWDVVNEAFYYDGNFRPSPWLNLIGKDYIEKAFEFAHQADPDVELYYNDYGLVDKSKQDAVVEMIQRLQEKGVPIHGVGIQGHYSLTYPDLERLDNAIARFSELGLKVMITELDVSVLPFPGPEERGEDAEINPARVQELNPYSEGLPDEAMQQLTDRYVDLFCIFLKHRDAVSRVTFWGVTDARSWRNDWPVKGRTDHPLLYDRNMQPKPVVPALVDLATNYQETCAHLWTEKE
ncbi:endo-1,4-beta-xylanase [Alkalimonas mucilaginosa]|uniref:Beta-xylanase n=1 Tax=Alkalimonas mucilaginosa TaxID=3057676 RepID=A0ABU7JFL1_9GAMM|nr:endo-1,4-beta-xylanase [Alkalimonas sp. MEB004]MEE2024477.1 endo-1,4-beta-xylanase [Alkalimonas sp. MEB004]